MRYLCFWEQPALDRIVTNTSWLTDDRGRCSWPYLRDRVTLRWTKREKKKITNDSTAISREITNLVFLERFQPRWRPTGCYGRHSRPKGWQNHCQSQKQKPKSIINVLQRWSSFPGLIYMRSGRKWWTSAQNARPSFHEVVMLVTFTPLYPDVTWRHLLQKKSIILEHKKMSEPFMQILPGF